MKPNNWEISQNAKDWILEAQIKGKNPLSLSNESPMRLFSADRKYQAAQFQPRFNEFQPTSKGLSTQSQGIQQSINTNRGNIQFQQMNNGGQILGNMNQATRQSVSSSMNSPKTDSFQFQNVLNKNNTDLEVNSKREYNKAEMKPASAAITRDNYAINNSKTLTIGVASPTITSKQNYYLPTSLARESPQINHLSNQQNRSNFTLNSLKEPFNTIHEQQIPFKSPQYGKQTSFNEMQGTNKSQSQKSLIQFDMNSPKERQNNLDLIVRNYQQTHPRQQTYSSKYPIGNNILRDKAQENQTPQHKYAKGQSFHSSSDLNDKSQHLRQSQEEMRSVSQSQQWPIKSFAIDSKNTNQPKKHDKDQNNIETSQNAKNFEEKQKISSEMNTPTSKLTSQISSRDTPREKIQQIGEQNNLSEQRILQVNTVNDKVAAHNQGPNNHYQNQFNSISINRGQTVAQTNQTSYNIPNLSISSPKAPTASFTQLKSPVAQAKMFLSPQSKWSLCFPEPGISSSGIGGSISVNNKKQTAVATGGGRNIFSLISQPQESAQASSSHQNASEQLASRLSSSEKNLNLTNNSISQGSKKSDSSVPQAIIEDTQSLRQLPKQFSFPFQQNTSSKQKQSFSNHSEQGVTNTITPQSADQYDGDIIPFQSLSSATMSAEEIEQIRSTVIPNHELTKFSVKRNGSIKSYAANTNQGLIRNYNEDRVSIILNIMKPQGKDNEQDILWPKCSFFGVYDGHGGVSCADFLRDNLHQFVIKNDNFPKYPRLALQKGFEAAEAEYLKQAQRSDGTVERAGSCAIVVLIVGKRCFVANVGDSRAILSGNSGTKAYDLSRDHKPLDDTEQQRIAEAGGRIYQTKIMGYQNTSTLGGIGAQKSAEPIYGPHRVLPGRLSVTRTFGDIEAKLVKLGGNPNVVIAVPDIKEFDITSEHDFILLASDGIYDKLSTAEIIESIWAEAKSKQTQYNNVHEFSGLAVDTVLKFGLLRKTMDNITVVIIGFDNLKKGLFQTEKKQELTLSPEKQKYKKESPSSRVGMLSPQSQQSERQYNLSQNGLTQHKQESSDEHNTNTDFNSTTSRQKQTQTGNNLSIAKNYHERKNISSSPVNKSSKDIKFLQNESESQGKNLLKQQQLFYQSPLSNQQEKQRHYSQLQNEAKLVQNQTERTTQFKNQISSPGQNWSFHLSQNSSDVRTNPSSNGLALPIRSTEGRNNLQSNLSMEKDKQILLSPSHASYGVNSTVLSDMRQNKLLSQRTQQYTIPLKKY